MVRRWPPPASCCRVRVSNAVALNAPAIINHFNNPGWEMVQELLVRMREQGHNVWGEIYPYAAGQTTIAESIPRL